MHLFPISDGPRTVPSAPGARRYHVSLDDLHERVREVLGGLPDNLLDALFRPLLPAGVDDDPDLGPALSVCGPRLLLLGELAILPPERRFNSTALGGQHRIFAAQRWINGVNGYAIAPSEFRPEMSVWAHSEGGLITNGEYGPLPEWLAEQLEPLEALVADTEELEPELIDTLTAQAADLWERIEGDLSRPQPRPTWGHPGPDWTGTLKAGRPHGRWVCTWDGVEVGEEHYRDGLRHGPTTRWHTQDQIKPQYASLTREQLMEIDDDWLESVRGPLERTGTFVDGLAHGAFRYFNDRGQPLQEGSYERGWPEGRWTVHPDAIAGLVEAATVQYAAGIPVSWQIPPFAIDVIPVQRRDAPATTLGALAPERDGVILVDCSATSDHDLAEDDARDLAALPGLLVVGIHPATPGSGSFGGRPMEIVADPAAGLARAYGADPDRPWLLTFLGAHGRLLGSSNRLSRLALAERFDPQRQR